MSQLRDPEGAPWQALVAAFRNGLYLTEWDSPNAEEAARDLLKALEASGWTIAPIGYEEITPLLSDSPEDPN